jgi:hypothetical protein
MKLNRVATKKEGLDLHQFISRMQTWRRVLESMSWSHSLGIWLFKVKTRKTVGKTTQLTIKMSCCLTSQSGNRLNKKCLMKMLGLV